MAGRPTIRKGRASPCSHQFFGARLLKLQKAANIRVSVLPPAANTTTKKKGINHAENWGSRRLGIELKKRCSARGLQAGKIAGGVERFNDRASALMINRCKRCGHGPGARREFLPSSDSRPIQSKELQFGSRRRTRARSSAAGCGGRCNLAMFGMNPCAVVHLQGRCCWTTGLVVRTNGHRQGMPRLPKNVIMTMAGKGKS